MQLAVTIWNQVPIPHHRLLVSLRSSTFLFCTQHTRMAACELSVFCCWVFYSTDPGESPSSCCHLLPRLDVTCFQRSVSTTEFSGDSQTADRKVGEPGGQGDGKQCFPTAGGPSLGVSSSQSCPITDAAFPWDLKRAPGALTSQVSQLTQTGEGCGAGGGEGIHQPLTMSSVARPSCSPVGTQRVLSLACNIPEF